MQMQLSQMEIRRIRWWLDCTGVKSHGSATASRMQCFRTKADILKMQSGYCWRQTQILGSATISRRPSLVCFPQKSPTLRRHFHQSWCWCICASNSNALVRVLTATLSRLSQSCQLNGQILHSVHANAVSPCTNLSCFCSTAKPLPPLPPKTGKHVLAPDSLWTRHSNSAPTWAGLLGSLSVLCISTI